MTEKSPDREAAKEQQRNIKETKKAEAVPTHLAYEEQRRLNWGKKK